MGGARSANTRGAPRDPQARMWGSATLVWASLVDPQLSVCYNSRCIVVRDVEWQKPRLQDEARCGLQVGFDGVAAVPWWSDREAT